MLSMLSCSRWCWLSTTITIPSTWRSTRRRTRSSANWPGHGAQVHAHRVPLELAELDRQQIEEQRALGGVVQA